MQRLHAAGFAHPRAWLRPEPVTFDEDDAFREFLRTVILRPWLAPREPWDQERLVDDVARELPDRTLEYVRLEIDATLGR